MAPRGTIYVFEVDLADSDRSVYESFKINTSMHPSETAVYLLTRVLAYVLEYREGISFTKGLDEPESPAIQCLSLDGRITHWIEVGNPSSEKLHRANKIGAVVSLYSYKRSELLQEQLNQKGIYNADSIKVTVFPEEMLLTLEQALEKRVRYQISVVGEVLYIEQNGSTIEIHPHRFHLV
jgi:uncharacterized protein YaeQ